MFHRFVRLDSAIDELHELFDAWDAHGTLAPTLDADGASVLRLAVHEWIANLVQHAAFPDGPEITLDVEVGADAVRCTVEDASVGFDFAGQVETQHAVLDGPAPSERGRGLLMLITCTEALSFRPASSNGARQRISFCVRAGTGAALFEPLFRPEDLADDFSLLGPDVSPGFSPAAGDGAASAHAHPDAP